MTFKLMQSEYIKFNGKYFAYGFWRHKYGDIRYHRNFSRQILFKGIRKVRVACSTRTWSVIRLRWYYVSLPVGEGRREGKVGGHPVGEQPDLVL